MSAFSMKPEDPTKEESGGWFQNPFWLLAAIGITLSNYVNGWDQPFPWQHQQKKRPSFERPWDRPPSGLSRLWESRSERPWNRPTDRPSRGLSRPGLSGLAKTGLPEENRTDRVGIATNRYWKVAVADLHKLRFVLPPREQPAGEYYKNLRRDLRAKIDAAKSASKANVDPELIAMAERHIATDEEYLQLIEEIDALPLEPSLLEDPTPIGKHLETGQRVFEALLFDPSQIDQIENETVQALIQNCIALETRTLEHWHEIEIMQAKLTERNPAPLGSDYFTLPNIDE